MLVVCCFVVVGFCFVVVVGCVGYVGVGRLEKLFGYVVGVIV